MHPKTYSEALYMSQIKHFLKIQTLLLFKEKEQQ